MSKSLLAAIFTALALCTFDASAQSFPNTLAKIKAAKAITVVYSPDSLPVMYLLNSIPE